MINQLTVFGIISILNCIACIAVGLFILLKNKKSAINISYCIFNFCIAFYAFFYFLWQSTSDLELSIAYFKWCIFGVVLINSAFVHFSFVVTNFKDRFKSLWFIHFINLFFAFSSLFLFYEDWKIKYSYGLWPIPSKVFHFYIIWWFFQVVYCFYILYHFGIKQAQGKHKLQFQWIFYSTLIAYAGGSTNWLVWYGINFPPYLNSGIAIYSIVLAYAIYRYQLLGIEVIIKRAAVFAGLFAFVYGTFALITVLGQEFFRNTLGWNKSITMIPTVIIITFTLRPLEKILTNITERFLFQKKYNYRELLRTFTNEILTVLDLQKLMDQTVESLVRITKIESACILLVEKETKAFKLVSEIGVKDKTLQFSDKDILISYLKASHHFILKDKIADKIEGDGDLKNSFKQLNTHLCLPILLHDELIGVLCLGMKKSGEEYTQEDIDILTTLARAEAIAISNARLFDELSKTQAEAAQREKMAVIGTLAAGINHEICNPLGIVRGQCEMFLLNLKDGFYSAKSPDELLKIYSDIMQKVIKETDRATAITKKLSGFAKPSKRSDLEEVRIEKEIDEVIGLIGHDLQLNNIDFQKDFPTSFPIFLADKKQIQEVLFNIIRNAAQAIDKKQGKIVVSGFGDNDYVVIRIADNGSGIPMDKIDQIFNPFYTTKAPGKGTGLGLFIVKQVVERNKGTISVESESGVGTTFTLKFPTATKMAVLKN